MLQNSQLKLKRTATLISILSKYGFKDVLARMNVQNNEQIVPDEVFNKSVYVRIRMALEELGPTFVKFGQAFAGREDLLPAELIAELQKLQDNVNLDDLDLETVLTENLGENYQDYFSEISHQPLASASIAQVYLAKLISGEKVVLKVKRPKIDKMIKGDLLLMKDLVKVLNQYFEFAENLNLEQGINTFEKSLLQELSFVNERENIERFAKNFKDDSRTIVPKVYPNLSNNDVLCLEFIDGFKITDFASIEKNNLSASKLAEECLQLFLAQILEHGFFHADPHAGNILVTKEGKIIFIDFGATGTIFPSDRAFLEDLIINLILKNVDQLVVNLKKVAIKFEIKDEKKLKDQILEILNLVDSNSLKDLKLEILIEKFQSILFENKIIMPDYFILLFKGVTLIEGVGRLLNPEMDVIKSAQPYISKIMLQRLDPKYLFEKGLQKLTEFQNNLQNIPVEFRSVLSNLNEGNLTFKTKSEELKTTNLIIKQSVINVVLAFVLGTNIIATALILTSNLKPVLFGMPLLAVLGFLFSAILGFILTLRLLKR
ncbi:ABC1 kinase family protein [Halpernia frigidisoli]|uniref:Ubiquinone biosynthesis protein n=1 Tax=Halpernia frigidisoli TaxID=1125876 RepID=A0A1I3DS06_9FLAO|nr:AarF/UbiB family protein [Halpernia frigidisoli]SFH89534.1 ubiquinone biosynthesis protein [Halpernia frigidisoli]